MIRLFTALPLSAESLGTLSLMRRSLPGVRWIDRENLHLTLQFIGEVDNGTYPRILDALNQCIAPAFSFDIRGGGFFGSARRPRVLWAGVEAAPELVALNRQLRDCLEPLVDLERRNYKPHISLARLKQCPPETLATLLESAHYLDMPRQQATEIYLYSSRRGSEGSRYSVEASFPLTQHHSLHE